jgi:F-box/leucine-rich repeat protein 14
MDMKTAVEDVKTLADIKALKGESLAVRGENLGDEELIALTRRGALQRLDLSGCDALTDASVKELSRLVRLEELDLSLCNQITDASVKALSQLPSLRSLSLNWCYQVSDVGVSALASSQSLEALTLWSCEKVTDRGVEALATLATLRRLELPDFAVITDVGLMALSSGASQIEMLRLDHLSRISDQGIRSLAGLKGLSCLLIKDCVQVSKAAVEDLQTALPACEVVFTN